MNEDEVLRRREDRKMREMKSKEVKRREVRRKGKEIRRR